MSRSTTSSESRPPVLSRRTVFAGAGVAGAAAVAAAVLPTAAPQATQVATALTDAAAAGGYQLTDHVKRYYQTARV